MKIGILGTGHIGKTLVQRLSAAEHDVKVANSRDPATIEPDVLAFGGRAVTAAEAVADVDVVILSIPLNRIPDIAPLIRSVPAGTVVIDTSNYYPHRDGRIEAIEAGQVESLWVAEQLGRPIVKAWNAIGSASFAMKQKPARSQHRTATPVFEDEHDLELSMALGLAWSASEAEPVTGWKAAKDSDRIAIPIAADRNRDREIAMALVEDTGLDAVDAGTLAESWRQQPGAPAYCTDLTRSEVPAALAAAERARLPKRRDLAVAGIQERVGDGTTNPDAEYGVRLNRALYM